MRPIIVWFRRDLRVRDHVPLQAAAATGAPVVPLFIVDTALIDRLTSDGAAFDFQAECLRDLDQGLAAIGGRLIVRRGTPEAVHTALIEEINPAALYFARDYEPAARSRDAVITGLYRQRGIDVLTFADCVMHEPGDLLTGDGKPYVVFTPYARAWKRLPVHPPAGMPARLTTPDIASTPIPDAQALGRPVTIPAPMCKGGESAAAARWQQFLDRSVGEYQTGRDHPAEEGTSRMSPYLRFGCISVRRMFHDCAERSHTPGPKGVEGLGKYVDELIWREFYQSVLYHFPHLLESNYREEFNRLPWRFDERTFTAWREGRTGFPLVDAGMRELHQTGWMHNRVRMVVASFLTKDLMHDWKLGAGVFEEKLLDIETASNNGGWQWAASTGVDPRPLRIFNPRLQSERFDADGTYIRRFVPELSRIPGKYIHAPHELPPLLQEEYGCVIGRDYPSPLVDHAAASAAYKKAFAAIKGRG